MFKTKDPRFKYEFDSYGKCIPEIPQPSEGYGENKNTEIKFDFQLREELKLVLKLV